MSSAVSRFAREFGEERVHRAGQAPDDVAQLPRSASARSCGVPANGRKELSQITRECPLDSRSQECSPPVATPKSAPDPDSLPRARIGKYRPEHRPLLLHDAREPALTSGVLHSRIPELVRGLW